MTEYGPLLWGSPNLLFCVPRTSHVSFPFSFSEVRWTSLFVPLVSLTCLSIRLPVSPRLAEPPLLLPCTSCWRACSYSLFTTSPRWSLTERAHIKVVTVTYGQRIRRRVAIAFTRTFVFRTFSTIASGGWSPRTLLKLTNSALKPLMTYRELLWCYRAQRSYPVTAWESNERPL